MWVKAVASAALVVALTSTPGQAQEAVRYELAGNNLRDIATTAGFTTTWLLAETAFKEPLSPGSCHWCSANGFDAWVRGGLVWEHATTAAKLSDVGLVLAAVNGFGALAWVAAADSESDDFAKNSLYVLQTVSITMTLTNVVKVLVARQRPAVHYQSNFASHLSESEQNLSFFSGHSAFTFAFATAAGSVASLRGYRHAKWVWTSGLAIAAFTAYARIGADAHYTTDVLTGGVVGASLGTVLPRWLHARTRPQSMPTALVAWQPMISPTAQAGALVGVNGLF